MATRKRRSFLRLTSLEDRTVPTAGGTVVGFAYVDANLNGQYDSTGRVGEQLIPGVTIYADLNANGKLDPGEPSGASPDANLVFAADGTYLIRSTDLLGARRTSPASVSVNVSGGAIESASFGFDVTLNSSGSQELLAVGADAGGGPHVKVFNADGSLRFEFLAYDPKFTGGVRVATADVNGDGTEDIITAPGPGGGPHIKVFDGRTGSLIREWMAYDPAFTGGVYIAAWRGHSAPQGVIVTGPGSGGGPHVRVWSATTGEAYQNIIAYDPNFRGGVTVAVADLNSDGTFPEIITGAGPGGGPHVKVYDGQTFQVIRSFFAYDPGFRGGVFVAAADTNHDSRIDIVTGAGPGGAPLVNSFDWFTGQMLQSFLAFDSAFRGGVRVAETAVPNPSGSAIAVAPGAGGIPYVRKLTTPGLQDIDPFFAFDPAFSGGVFVG
jgi:hypothetical protein